MDIRGGMRNTALMLNPGALKGSLGWQRLKRRVRRRSSSSEQTLSHRLGLLFGARLVDPGAVIGDLTIRTQHRSRWPSAHAAAWRELILGRRAPEATPLVLALDWIGGDSDLMIGRAAGCDIELTDDTVSRRHAKLAFRAGSWSIQDLGSTNGTIVNGKRVGRCQLEPGDRVRLGEQLLAID